MGENNVAKITNRLQNIQNFRNVAMSTTAKDVAGYEVTDDG